jgi:hypothetical protein
LIGRWTAEFTDGIHIVVPALRYDKDKSEKQERAVASHQLCAAAKGRRAIIHEKFESENLIVDYSLKTQHAHLEK